MTLLGGDGLKDVSWDVWVCLMGYVDVVEVVVVFRVCKRLNEMVGTWLGRVYKLMEDFEGDKLVLTVCIDARRQRMDTPSQIEMKFPQNVQYKTQFLVYQSINTYFLDVVRHH
eukprot:TRINITY_DN16474_c0_g1_i1.p1 TRINITY_DN16474_c0_g1~~TRINITY_DN16474_c0_g1_i1.p1  ORF type:complete len:113 (-),score=25.76 TRINITY_DN16474_c0_g1_i1:210-548(-)